MVEGARHAGPEPLERRRLMAFTSWFLALGSLCAAAYLTAGLLFDSESLLYTCLATIGILLGVIGARTFARQGRTDRAALTISVAILAAIAIVAPVMRFAWPVLAFGSILALAVALRYLDGRLLLAVAAASVVIGAAAVVWGIFGKRGSDVPLAVRAELVAGTTAVVMTLIMVMLFEFSQRLRALLKSALTSAERSGSAYSRLAETNQTLDAIIEASPAAVMLLDLDGTVRLWNRRAERLFGWSASDVIGRPLPSVPEELLGEFRANLERVASGEPVLGLETRRRRREGEDVDVELWSAPVRYPDGSVQCVCMVADITERKRAEAALRSEEEKARLAYERARAADRRKDEFLALLGHELRNPLAPIVTALQLMKLKNHGDSFRELDILERQVDHLVRLVDDLLDVSRVTRGKIRLKKKPFDLAEAVESAVEMASPLIEERRHVLEIAAPRGEVWTLGDQARIAQVIANLLTNAAKYTEPEGSLRLYAGRDPEEAWVRVEDDGVGIAPEALPYLFKPFAQGGQSIDRAEGGLGLGLMLVRSLVELHGGHVEAQSEGPGCGSRFTVWLPLARGAVLEQCEPALEAPEEEEAAGRRVLVVDDNEDAADMLADVLRLRGWEVAVAHDGPSALGVAREFRPAVAILDIGLPVMDGYELCGRLREEAADGGIRCLAITGYGQEKDRARSLEAGFSEHLVKPVDLQALVAALSPEGPDSLQGRA